MSRNRSIDSCIHPARVVRSSHRARTIPLDSLDEMYPRPNRRPFVRVDDTRARTRVGRITRPFAARVRDASEREPRVETESVAKRSVESR